MDKQELFMNINIFIFITFLIAIPYGIFVEGFKPFEEAMCIAFAFMCGRLYQLIRESF